MKFTKLSLIAALTLSTAFAGGDIAPVETVAVVEAEPASEIEVSANLAITSNYIWRGMTQSSDSPAVQGGIDLGYKGFYLGTWGSNVEFDNGTDNNLEADFYGGYKSSFAGVGFDIGYIYYAYPNDSDDSNFDEIYVGLDYDFGVVAINGKYSFGIDSNIDTTDYWEVGASAPLPMEFTLAGSYGDYDKVGSNYLVSLSKTWGKFDFSIAYADFDGDRGNDDQDNIIGTISTSF